MSSIGGILSTATTALTTHQKAMAVTAHNISNAETEGYSRQRATLTANPPLITPQGVVGAGVGIEGIERVRDGLLDTTYRRETASTALYAERASQLTSIEAAFGEPSDTGLLATLDGFWNAWSDLASNPGNDASRAVIRERGAELTDRLHQISDQLVQQRAAGLEKVDTLLARVNELSENVADMNRRIVSAEAAGGDAGDLRDARDRALDELSSIIGTQVIERDSGAVGVYVDGNIIVDGDASRSLVSDTDSAGEVVVRFSNRSTPIAEPGGRVGGVLTVLNGELTAAERGLNAFAADLVTAVNALVTSNDGDPTTEAVNPLGQTGVSFFDPAGTSASTIALPAAVQADPQAIAAGTGSFDTTSGTWQYLSGRNDVALGIQALRDTAPPAGGAVLAERVTTLVTDVGAQVSSARSSHEVHQTLTQQADLRRVQVSGVSIDEELATMIRQQAAYGAAARVVSRVDEMLQTLIEMV